MKIINKYECKPGKLLYPLQAIMVSCGKNYNEYNITTIFWTGTINTVQPMVYFDI